MEIEEKSLKIMVINRNRGYKLKRNANVVQHIVFESRPSLRLDECFYIGRRDLRQILCFRCGLVRIYFADRSQQLPFRDRGRIRLRYTERH